MSGILHKAIVYEYFCEWLEKYYLSLAFRKHHPNLIHTYDTHLSFIVNY